MVQQRNWCVMTVLAKDLRVGDLLSFQTLKLHWGNYRIEEIHPTTEGIFICLEGLGSKTWASDHPFEVISRGES